MLYVYVDPSALVKRYHQEPGTKLFNKIFAKLQSSKQLALTSVWSIAETITVLHRVKNQLDLPEDEWTHMLATVIEEIRTFRFLEITDERVLGSIPYALTYNLNSADALHLKTVLDVQSALASAEDQVLLVACDKRLLRAAHSEVIPTLNPEEDTEEKVKQLFNEE
jgi:predicted nucleic acid-binding protein